MSILILILQRIYAAELARETTPVRVEVVLSAQREGATLLHIEGLLGHWALNGRGLGKVVSGLLKLWEVGEIKFDLSLPGLIFFLHLSLFI